MIHAFWNDSERRRWENHRASREENARDGTSDSADQRDCSDPYNEGEKGRLKDFYGNEFKFLQAYELSIDKDEDREKGRAFVRALMRAEEDCGWEEDQETKAIAGHLADYNFTDQELEFFERHWKNAMSFMYSHGLIFYDKEDLKKAQIIVRASMIWTDGLCEGGHVSTAAV